VPTCSDSRCIFWLSVLHAAHKRSNPGSDRLSVNVEERALSVNSANKCSWASYIRFGAPRLGLLKNLSTNTLRVALV
jgi:hypothetical protein